MTNRKIEVKNKLVETVELDNRKKQKIDATELENKKEAKSHSSEATLDATMNKKQHIYLDTSVIYHPQKNCVYHLNAPYSPTIDTQITFVGNVEQYELYDISSSAYRETDSPPKKIGWTNPEKYCFIARAALPISMKTSHLPQILVYFFNDPDILYAQPHYEINIDDGCAITFSLTEIARVRVLDASLKHQKWAGNLPIIYGKHPLFIDDLKPSSKALGTIYQKFVNHNPPETLAYQALITDNLCHIRAFFASEMLKRYYGLTSQLAYKIWNAEDWSSFPDNKHWGFHCATKVGKWVFDPWSGSTQSWTRLDKWLFRTDEPRPIKLFLTHSSVFSDLSCGRRADGLNFMTLDFINSGYIRAFQFLCANAIPNNPEKPIISAEIEARAYIQQFGFFQRKNNKLQSEEMPPLVDISEINGINLN